jgi:DNA-directed RNA polymerase specialized sigma subunit
MPTEYIKIKRKVKDIPDIRSFNSLLEASTFSDIDKEIIRMYYLQERDFAYIADSLGYTEQTVKLKHKKAIMKLSKLI